MPSPTQIDVIVSAVALLVFVTVIAGALFLPDDPIRWQMPAIAWPRRRRYRGAHRKPWRIFQLAVNVAA